MKGTKKALTIWHCFYCLTKKKIYFNFSCVSGMVKQAVFIYIESLSADLCEQRIVKTVLERNQHSSTKPACICTFLPLHKPASFS